MDGTMRMLSKTEYGKLFDIKPACLQGHTGIDTEKIDLNLSNEEKHKYWKEFLPAKKKFCRFCSVGWRIIMPEHHIYAPPPVRKGSISNQSVVELGVQGVERVDKPS